MSRKPTIKLPIYPADTPLLVLVPRAGSVGDQIHARSAVVTLDPAKAGEGPLKIYMQGDQYNDGLPLHEKLQLAVSRLLWRAPTIAKLTADSLDAFQVVGYVTYDPWSLVVTDRAAMEAYGFSASDIDQAVAHVPAKLLRDIMRGRLGR